MNLTLKSTHFHLLLLLHLLIPSTTSITPRDERHGLLELRDSITSSASLHNNWTGPPCINQNISRWIGITCCNSHVIHLVLDHIHLTGSLPPTFLSNLTFLTILTLNHNSISGPLPNLTHLKHLTRLSLSFNRFTSHIPYHYTQLPNLTTLELQFNGLDGEIPPFDQNSLTEFNVSGNRLRGLIPDTGVIRRFERSSFDHNRDLCGFPVGLCDVVSPAPAPVPGGYTAAEKDRKKRKPIWVNVLIAVPVGFMVLIVFLCCYRKVKNQETVKETDNFQSGEETERREDRLEFFERNIPYFDLDDLLRASAEVLGKGKHGATYKANLELSGDVAVKRLKSVNDLGKNEFIQQMQLIGKLRHENVVKIISFYYSKEEKLIIYEYLPDGNLFELLHEDRELGREALDWKARVSIIKDIAKGLAFLHRSLPKHKVPHGNLKSSNILIHKHNQSYHSKLTNYGFLPLFPSKKSFQTLAIGRSPEFSEGKKLTRKTDIYCFGIVLLEIITGRIPEEEDGEKIEDLSDWVKSVVNNDWSTDILDVEILGSREGHDQMLKLTEMALECTDLEPLNRPKITQLLTRIQEIDI
ncbi:Leucine-rich repeat protein kinase family protein [Euphorbia peplus]|nr:Leucine-rich repeat protein kinase family protein [Euphorbia peplus]